MFTKKTIIIMLSVIAILLIFIGSLLVWQKYFLSTALKNQAANNNGAGNENPPASSVAAGKTATQDLINEVKNSASQSNSPAKVVTVNQNIDGKNVPVQAVSVAKGTSPITVDTGEVVAKSGDAAQNNVLQGTASSPTQSVNIDPVKLPKNSFNLTLNSNQTITPNSFTVHPGQAVLLAITNNTPWSEVILFHDPSLAAIGFSLLANTTRAMTFNAPNKLGEYVFSSDVPSQAEAGLQGKMIVK